MGVKSSFEEFLEPPARFCYSIGMHVTVRVSGAALAALLVVSCGEPPAQRIDRLYRGLDEELPRISPDVLSGRRIIIDPGHGGYYRGTVGQGSLEEASVNLGVGLYLWGLLREAGADAHLTRSNNRDFLTTADSTLAGDLGARVALSDSLEPDAFISIHHNAQPLRDPTVNRIETYYRAGDPASLELAFAVHRHLARNLGIDAGDVRQGNYFVLRENDAPAILGESSYLTHPLVEDRLRLSDVQRLEAESYFLGLLDYFNRGLPHARFDSPSDSVVAGVPAIVASVWDDGGGGIDPGTVNLSVDGVRVLPDVRPARRDTVEIRWPLPPDAPNGRYEARLTVRNAGGNTSPVRTVRFEIRHAPEMAVVQAVPPSPPPSGDLWIRCRILDARGIPVADGTPVRARAEKGAEHTGTTSDGTFAFSAPAPAGKTLRVTVAIEGREFESTLRFPRPAPGRPWKSRVVVDRTTRLPVAGARSVAGAPAHRASGVVFTPAGREAVVTAPGYRPVVVHPSWPDTLALDAWFGGVLVGKRFVLDPQGGDGAGSGAFGLEASWVNLRVAEMLAEFLRRAGAHVRLTRSDEAVGTPEDIARTTNAWKADRYVEIRHPALPADSAYGLLAWYFPGSRNGRRMAREVGATAASILGVPMRGAGTTVTFPLQQTACPAVVLSFPSIAIHDEELRLDRPAWQRAQAWAAFVGIVGHFEAPAGGVINLIPPANGQSSLVIIDDTWTLRIEDRMLRIPHLPPGNHVLEVRRGAFRTRESFVTTAGDTLDARTGSPALFPTH